MPKQIRGTRVQIKLVFQNRAWRGVGKILGGMKAKQGGDQKRREKLGWEERGTERKGKGLNSGEYCVSVVHRN